MNSSHALKSAPALMAEMAGVEAERVTKRGVGLGAARSGVWPEGVGSGAGVGSDRRAGVEGRAVEDVVAVGAAVMGAVWRCPMFRSDGCGERTKALWSLGPSGE